MKFDMRELDLGVRYKIVNSTITPRPIAWIVTRGENGVINAAPYSFFNAVAYTPPQVGFASTSAKPDRDGTKDGYDLALTRAEHAAETVQLQHRVHRASSSVIVGSASDGSSGTRGGALRRRPVSAASWLWSR